MMFSSIKNRLQHQKRCQRCIFLGRREIYLTKVREIKAKGNFANRQNAQCLRKKQKARVPEVGNAGSCRREVPRTFKVRSTL